MATIVDAFYVTLGIQQKGFTAGLKQARSALKQTSDETTRVAKEMEARGKQAAEFFSKIRNEALSMLAVFTAGVGLKNFTENTIVSAANLGRLSENLGMSTERLSAWQRAAERAGGSAEGITAQLKESSKEVAKFKAGQASESTQWFFRMGGSVDALKDGNTYLLARVKIVNDIYKTDKARAALVASQIGISEDQFNLLKQEPAALLAQVAAQQKRSVVSAKEAKQADELRKKFLDLRDIFTAIGTKVLIALIPVFDRLITKLEELGNWINNHKSTIVKWVNDAIDAVISFSEWADKAAASVGGWKNVLIALAGLKILSMTSDILGLASAFLSLSGALGGIATMGASALPILGRLAPVAAGLLLLTQLKRTEPPTAEEFKEIGNGNWSKLIQVFSFSDFFKTAWNDMTGKSASNKKAMRYDDPQLNDYARSVEQRLGLPPNILNGIKNYGERSNSNAVSPKGAKGVMQFMPQTWAQYGKGDITDPYASIDAGGAYFKDLLQRYGGNVDAAITEYNGGVKQARHVQSGGEPQAAETKKYLDRVRAGIGQMNASYAANVPMGAAAAAYSTPIASSTHNNTSEVNIQNVNIQTQATDADGIARDFPKAMNKYPFVAQANTGLQ